MNIKNTTTNGMDNSPFQDINDAVSNGRLNVALDTLLEVTSSTSSFHKEVVDLYNQHKQTEKQLEGGEIHAKQAYEIFERIGAATLELTKLMEQEEQSQVDSPDLQELLSQGLLDEAIQGIYQASQVISDEKIPIESEQLWHELQQMREQQRSKKGLFPKEVAQREQAFTERANDLISKLSRQTKNEFAPNVSANKTPTQEAENTGVPSLLDVQARMENDQWAKHDLLGYEIYAEVIANMLIDPLSSPPLAIGVIAPWGHGKTTLMHYIRKRLESEVSPQDLEGSPSSMENLMAHSDRHMADYQDVQKWLKELDEKEEQPNNTTFHIDQKAWPTVWFNPWQYQSSAQIWAGMAHALIQQLVARLDPLEKEKFFFQLHMKRVDKNAIRQDIFQTIALSLIPNLGIILLALVLYLILSSQPLNLSQWLVFGFPGGIGLFGLIQGGWKWWEGSKKGITDKYQKYFQQPEYENKLGMYHEVQTDLQRVFDLLVIPDRPVVLFIDDLDRCSPKRVAEVVEAINLLMNGSYRDKCYFVLGMDAQIVAAALDVAYKDMYGRLDNRAKTAGSIGWYFLDKFIQLPFFIPTLDESEKTKYLQKLFGETDHPPNIPQQPNTRPPNEEELKALVKEQVQKAKRGERSEQTRENQRFKAKMDRLFIEVSLEESRDSKEILEQLKIYAPFLEDSPRGLKRFANLLRFHTAIQQLRIRDGVSHASTAALAKWLTINLRWPQFVRWLQWSKEEHQLTIQTEKNDSTKIRNAVHGLAPKEKATRIDTLMDQLPYIEKSPENLEELFQSQWLEKMKYFPQVPWLSDIELFEILYIKRSHESRLERAILVDIW